ncbi:NUDIX domain-containing protein [Candidatus Woesearchaeota archaeon]|nr:NUDIX domain-containing protein [Candidatus Woesearchaeota archaeon]
MKDKTEFYKEIRNEYKKKGKITKQVHTLRIFLMNSHGGIYLTKRSKLKKENTLLYDKTIGAHIRGDESEEYTLLRESAEELGFPAAVLSETEFVSAITEADLYLIGIFKRIETINRFIAKYKYKDGTYSNFPQITTIYIGIFDGPIKFKDGETSGVEIFYPDEILDELKKYPEKYTEDVKILIPKYLNEFKNILKLIKKLKKTNLSRR